MHLLLLSGELLPVALLLGPQGSNFTLILLEPVKKKVQHHETYQISIFGQPDCWERGHDAVDVGDLAVGTIANDFPAANVNLSESKSKRSLARRVNQSTFC